MGGRGQNARTTGCSIFFFLRLGRWVGGWLWMVLAGVEFNPSSVRSDILNSNPVVHSDIGFNPLRTVRFGS